MIENEKQLHYSYECLAKLYRLRERELAETLWDAGTREDVVAGTDAMIHKIEREITDYLSQRADKAA